LFCQCGNWTQATVLYCKWQTLDLKGLKMMLGIVESVRGQGELSNHQLNVLEKGWSDFFLLLGWEGGRRRRGGMGLGTCSRSASCDLQLYFWQIMKKGLILVTLYFWHLWKTSLTLLSPSVCLLSPGCFLPVLFSSLSGTNWLLAPCLFDTKLNSWRFLDYRNIMSCRDWGGMSKAFGFSMHYYRAIKSDFLNLFFCFSRRPGVCVGLT
jgi:hypothetical protein